MTGPESAASGVIVIVHEMPGDAEPAALAHAADLARRGEVPLTIYDRSDESWVDTPIPEGPFGLDHACAQEHERLRSLMERAESLGVEVRGWLSSLPSISGITTAVSATDADVVVVASDLGGRVTDMVSGGRDFAQTVANQFVDDPLLCPTVVVVDADGGTDVVEQLVR